MIDLKVHEVGYVVVLGESTKHVCFVLKDSADDVVGNPDVEHVALAGEDIDVAGFPHVGILTIMLKAVGDEDHIVMCDDSRFGTLSTRVIPSRPDEGGQERDLT